MPSDAVVSMFSRAQQKLEDARLLFAQVQQPAHPIVFRSRFNSFLAAARAVTQGLQKDGRHSPGFLEWYGEKQREMREDEVMRFVNDARNSDLKRGESVLEFKSSLAVVGLTSPPGAGMQVSSEGAF